MTHSSSPSPLQEAERGILGACMQDADALCDAAEILRPEDFSIEPHQLMWRGMLDLWGDSKPVTAPALAEILKQRNQVDLIGGYIYIAHTLDAFTIVPANVKYHALKVREAAILRRLTQAGQTIAHDAAHPDDEAEAILERAENAILAVADVGLEGKTVCASEVLPVVLAAIDERCQRREISGIASGLLELDAITAGFRPGELILIGARPGVGKTTFGLGLARFVLGKGIPVFFVSLEQSNAELIERLLVAESLVPARLVRLGAIKGDHAARLHDAFEYLSKTPCYLDDTPVQGIARIRANARRLQRRHKIGLMIVDYLQLVAPENRRDPRHEQVGQISRRLKALARELGIPVLALAQLNRAVENRANDRPRLSDLRESGSLEADADVVLLLHELREKDAPPKDCLEVIVAKNRHGPTGEVVVGFRRELMRIEDGYQTPFARRPPDELP